MSQDSKVMYNEVYSFLNILGNNYINKIPRRLYEFIKSQSSENYNLPLNIQQNISEQILPETLTFISYLNLMYWATPAEKEKLLKIYRGNDRKAEEKLRELYNPDNIFKDRKHPISNDKNNKPSTNNHTDLIQYHDVPWYKRIFNKIKKIFFKEQKGA